MLSRVAAGASVRVGGGGIGVFDAAEVVPAGLAAELVAGPWPTAATAGNGTGTGVSCVDDGLSIGCCWTRPRSLRLVAAALRWTAGGVGIGTGVSWAAGGIGGCGGCGVGGACGPRGPCGSGAVAAAALPWSPWSRRRRGRRPRRPGTAGGRCGARGQRG
ncbi:hypothetical protein ACCO45_013818 [Purpureocillium lilacinum]|uniref:Uncharacterized protein n=1 Tax=Purpureocillium lilacinum TaxID=33203 RepID=A0ACC4D7B2_PURLI